MTKGWGEREVQGPRGKACAAQPTTSRTRTPTRTWAFDVDTTRTAGVILCLRYGIHAFGSVFVFFILCDVAIHGQRESTHTSVKRERAALDGGGEGSRSVPSNQRGVASGGADLDSGVEEPHARAT